MAFYLSAPQSCPYLPDQDELLILSDPQQVLGSAPYNALLQKGFRRNGGLAYRPACPHCDACVSVRIPVEHFRLDRGQRRVWQRNRDLQVAVCAPHWDAAHAALFGRYQRLRHPGGGMDEESLRLYQEMILETGGVDARLLVFSLAAEVVAVALVDIVPAGVSAVYTFYAPEMSARGLGVYAILWQIAWTRGLGLPHLYLGYWVSGSPKMDYKRRYRPLEGFVAGRWRALAEGTGAR